MNFWKLLFGFVPVYKWRLILYIFLNLLCSVVSIISFSAVIPLLYILFGLSNPNIEMTLWSEITSFSSLLDVLKNNILFYLQEQIIHNGTSTALFIICAFIVITSFFSNIVSYFSYFVRIPIRTGIARDLRFHIYEKLVALSPSAYRGENKGDFVGRMTTDIEEVDYGIGTAMDMLIENPVQIIVYLVTLFGISMSLASAATCLLLIACTLVIIIGYYMKEISFKGQGLKGKLISMYEETIEKNTIIRVFNLGNYFLSKFQKHNELLRNTHNRMNRVYSIAFPLADFMSIIVMTIVLFIGGTKVFNGSIDIDAAELIYFIIIFHSIIRPTRSVIKATYGIRKAMASLDRIEHILHIRSQKDNIETVDIEMHTGEHISFSHVSFGYNAGCNVLNDINIKIPLGCISAIHGSNGKGKTSIIRLLMKLETRYHGNICIGNFNIKDISSNQIRELFSYVPQDSLLFNDSILNNILLGNPNASFEDVVRVANLVGIHNYVSSLEQGYDTIIGEQGMNLSGGQKQAIGIARALLKDAPIMIMDEATSGIDADAELKMMKNIKDYMCGKTLIVISHSANILKEIPYQIRL